MLQLQHNSPNDWELIIATINFILMRTLILDKDVVLTSPAIPLQIDIPNSWIDQLISTEPYTSEIARPQKNSADDRL